MALQETLAKVHAEIDSGRLYQARERLHGLVRSYPDNHELRWLLGDIYWRLNYPAMAGRWWWLLPPERPEVSAAFKAWSDMCGGGEHLMSHRARPYPHIEKLPEGHYRERLKTLYRDMDPNCDETTCSGSDGCGVTAEPVAVVSILLFALVGIVTVFGWLVRWVS